MYSYKNLSGAHQELKVFDVIKSSRQSVAAMTLAVALRVLPTVGLPLSVFNCISNNQIDLTEIENKGKATQTEWLSSSNITVSGGIRWRNAFASPNTGSASPEFDLPNKNFRHVKDNTVMCRIWRLDQNGARMTGEAHVVQINAANGRVIDDAVNNSPNGTFKINNYPEFTTSGPVYGVQFEFYYYNGTATGHPFLLSEYSAALTNPAAKTNRIADLSASPLFIINQDTPPADENDYSKADFYLGFTSGYTLPSTVGRIVGEGTSSIREIPLDVSDVFEGGLSSNGNYLANNTPVVVAKLSAKMKALIIEKGSVVLSLPGYPRVSLVKTQIKTEVSNAFGSGTASNTNTTTVSQNYGGVDNSILWTVRVVTDGNGVQYNEYTISNAQWNALNTLSGIPVGQIRVLIVRGLTGVASDTQANNLLTTYSPAGTEDVAYYENLGLEVPVNNADGSALAGTGVTVPLTNANGLGPQIGQGGTGNTVIRFRTNNTAINTVRQANDETIRMIVFNVTNFAGTKFIHTINLAIDSGNKAQKDHEITEYEP